MNPPGGSHSFALRKSRHIRLVLLGTVAAGAIPACNESSYQRPVLRADLAYPNNFHVQGAGFYHAHFRAWFHRPYNQLDPQTGQYFAGGLWFPSPHQSIANMSKPTPEALRQAQALHAASQPSNRGGFGRSSSFRSFGS
ncbi:MAG: hypothetical protein FJ405_08295 [Verrucomicrobia bacterium]|nr:hypothetical protein [Verrucomicrobiota bacterium]